MNRIEQLNNQFNKPTTDVWLSMDLDAQMTDHAVYLRKDTQRVMQENYTKINEHVDNTTMPFFVLQQLRDQNGLQIKGLTHMEAGSITYELAKLDGSVAMAFLVHNCLGMAVVDALGDEE